MTDASTPPEHPERATQGLANDGQGLVCPHCGCRHLEVYYTRRQAGVIRRCRICRHCGHRLHTSERVVQSSPPPH